MPDKSVLFTWELGDGLGHLKPLLYQGQLLQQAREVSCSFAMRDPVLASSHMHRDAGRLLAAPHFRQPDISDTAKGSYAAILARQGYMEEDILTGLIRSWRDLIDLVKPDLIVADHSPSAILAARDRVPVLHVGTAYTIPPVHAENFPVLAGGDREKMIRRSDGPMLAVVNRVLSNLDLPQLGRLPEMLKAEAECIYTLPQLDPYRNTRYEDALGPLEPPPPCRLYPADFRIMAYLDAAYPAFDTVVDILLASRYDCSAYVRGLRPSHYQLLQAKGLRVSKQPPPFGECMPQATLILHHGGAATAQAAVLAGRPQLILPQQAEAGFTARCLEAMKVGASIEADKIASLPGVLNGLANDRQIRDRAMATAQDARASVAYRAPDVFVEKCQSLLG